MPFSAQWGDFGIMDCLTNTEYNKALITDIFQYLKVRVVKPYIDSVFMSSIEPKKMVINIVAKDQSDINKIIKPFYWKYPAFKWVSFRDLRGFPKEGFANALRDAAVTVWVDTDTSFGYSALEAMKSGSIVIAKIPDTELEWLNSDDENSAALRNCCVWFDSFHEVQRQIATVVRSWVTDNVPNELFEEGKKVTELYSENKTKEDFLSYLTDLFETRKGEMEKLIEHEEQLIDNDENNDK
jgi:hypothetical protein